MVNVFTENDIFLKIKNLESACNHALSKSISNQDHFHIPEFPSRGSLEVLPPQFHPKSKGLSYKEGQARLLHDLASIELQAMELALRTLFEYPDAPQAFREELYHLTLSEGKHLEMCLSALTDMGFQWGFRPVHIQLWNTVSSQDSLLDRILIVHRYLEGSGLDAGESMIRRLHGINDKSTITLSHVIKHIQKEEIDHVQFGSFWYKNICEINSIDPSHDFAHRLNQLSQRLPKRLEKINRELRLKAGFSESEIETIENYRKSQIPWQTT